MKRIKALSIILIFILVSQVVFSHLVVVSGADSGQSNTLSENTNKIEVKNITQHEESITWNVIINGSLEESVYTTIKLGSGLTHGTVKDVSGVTVQKTDQGYEVKLPDKDEEYTIELTTKIDSEQESYSIEATTSNSDEDFSASDTVTVEIEEKIASEDEKEKEKEAVEEKKPEEKGETKEEEVGEGDESIEQDTNLATHPPFATTARPFALPGVMSGDIWPAPGSLKLDKQAEATSNYAEWEVELNVKGKNLKTSSDIVLVFDRSNSMYASRLQKAKTAAKEFVDNLLIEGSTARIALVPFGTNADPHTDFTDFSGRQSLKNAIDRIRVTGGNDGGTNIQAGLRSAQSLLANSNADMKTIVLLSDGEPTYSFKASSAAAHQWPGNKYNFILSGSGSNRIGSGSSYNLSSGWGGHQYNVNGYTVRTNGIPTISEAKHIMNAGTGIYSIGLEVGNVPNAIYVLENSQNKGYFAGGDDDMTPIFNQIAASLAYAATNAVVTDPLGEMFDLVKDGSYSGANFEASHGTVTWDEASETFSWDIGDIKEDEVYSLKYKVTIDCTKNPEGNVKYPTNKETPLNYKDSNGNSATKQFPIPKVKVDTGKIDKKGYRVNVDGDPVDSNGNVVSSPADAEQFYDEQFGDNLAFGETYNVPANNVPDYTLIVGDDPTAVQLTAGKVCETVWFGYVKTTEMVAGDVTAKYVDEDGNEIADQEVFSGNIGDSYTTEQKDVTGYEFKEMHDDSADATGTFKREPQEVIYVYTKKLGSLTVIKVGEENEVLQGAEFELLDSENNSIGIKTTGDDGKIAFENLEWGDYTLKETKAPEGYRLLVKEVQVTISKDNLEIEKTIENTLIGWEIPKTGGIGTLGFYGLGAVLIIISLILTFRRRHAS